MKEHALCLNILTPQSFNATLFRIYAEANTLQKSGKKIGEVRVRTYLVKNDTTLLRLEEAKIRPCTLPEEDAKSRECSERGRPKGRECEELVLIYRPSGCIREKHDIDLNATTTVRGDIPEKRPALPDK